MSKNYYKFIMDDEESIVEFNNPSQNEFFYHVAAEECMSDCSGVNITEIVFQGQKRRWIGWMPDMEYTFVCVENPELEWTVWLPHMEH